MVALSWLSAPRSAGEEDEVPDHAAKGIRHEQPDGFAGIAKDTVKLLGVLYHAVALLLRGGG